MLNADKLKWKEAANISWMIAEKLYNLMVINIFMLTIRN